MRHGTSVRAGQINAKNGQKITAAISHGRAIREILFLWSLFPIPTLKFFIPASRSPSASPMVGVLKGAAPFLADLARTVQVDATFDFVATSSYGKGVRSSGAVKLIKDLDAPIEGKNVLVVEDILDTGLTLSYLRKFMMQQHPKTLRIATLLDKPSRRLEKIEADYVGFSIPNLFVIGYGMDYAERYRNLPDICLMTPDHPE
jgi:hypoxanthine phosphoribosyltransferase